jgi:hypothetical protein
MYGMGNNGDYKFSDSYYISLLYFQYYIAKVLVGTDIYLNTQQNPYRGKPPNPGENMDFSVPIENRQTSDAFDPTNNESIQEIYIQHNIKCEQSGIDYLLLVFREEPPRTRCDSRSYLGGSAGCEWLKPSDGTTCDQYVVDTDGVLGPGGYLCEVGPETMEGRSGHGQCKNGGICDGNLPTTSRIGGN